MKLAKRDHRPPTMPQTSLNINSTIANQPSLKCQFIALPPTHAVAIDASTQAANIQWNSRVGKSHTRTVVVV